jgi:hypothetical protein
MLEECVLIRMMQLVWPTDEPAKDGSILVKIGVLPPMENTGNEVSREE